MLIVKLLQLLLTLASDTKGEKPSLLGREMNSVVGRIIVLKDATPNLEPVDYAILDDQEDFLDAVGKRSWIAQADWVSESGGGGGKSVYVGLAERVRAAGTEDRAEPSEVFLAFDGRQGHKPWDTGSSNVLGIRGSRFSL